MAKRNREFGKHTRKGQLWRTISEMAAADAQKVLELLLADDDLPQGILREDVERRIVETARQKVLGDYASDPDTHRLLPRRRDEKDALAFIDQQARFHTVVEIIVLWRERRDPRGSAHRLLGYASRLAPGEPDPVLLVAAALAILPYQQFMTLAIWYKLGRSHTEIASILCMEDPDRVFQTIEAAAAGFRRQLLVA